MAFQAIWIYKILAFFALTPLVSLIWKNGVSWIEKKNKMRKVPLKITFLNAFYHPTMFGFWLFAIKSSMEIVFHQQGLQEIKGLQIAYQIALVALLFWASSRFIGQIEDQLVNAKHKWVDLTTIRAMSKLFHAIVLSICFLILLQIFGLSISGLIAFGGVGGLAIGFAAKEMLSNFFGSLTIFLDRPFAIGDWIRSPDREIEGVVEHIGWRHTRIMTFDRRPLYVPNSIFLSIALENPSRMECRKIKMNFSLPYSQVEGLEALLKEANAWLLGFSKLDQSKANFIKIIDFSPQALVGIIQCYTPEKGVKECYEVQQQIVLNLLKLFKEKGLSLTIPVQIDSQSMAKEFSLELSKN